ncbi:MAG: hypothetical protein C5B47_04705 [Verrucomicrobia bacterium]|nr:MAG: hypothetical protein C5B47_04705 [Verrucomicrobiota bacterium]
MSPNNVSNSIAEQVIPAGLMYSAILVTATLLLGCAAADCVRCNESKARPFRVQESTTVLVPACSKWVPTGIIVRQGECYSVESLPPDRWYDLIVAASATGYRSKTCIQRHFEPRRRVPSAPWFALCGSVTTSGRPFALNVLSTENSKEMNCTSDNGQLGVFANDIPDAYWNNWGSLRVRITRIH